MYPSEIEDDKIYGVNKSIRRWISVTPHRARQKGSFGEHYGFCCKRWFSAFVFVRSSSQETFKWNLNFTISHSPQACYATASSASNSDKVQPPSMHD